MKLITCKIMGEVSSMKCFDCFANKLFNQSFSTRVLCKKENVTEEIMLERDVEQPILEFAAKTAKIFL